MGKFDNIVLICPTFVNNRMLDHFAEIDPQLYVIICKHHHVENWLKIASFYFEGTNALIVLDDCAASKRHERTYRRAGEAQLFGSPCQH